MFPLAKREAVVGAWTRPYGRLYDPTKEQIISGQVVSIETTAPMPGMAPGMQMLVQQMMGRTRVYRSAQRGTWNAKIST